MGCLHYRGKRTLAEQTERELRIMRATKAMNVYNPMTLLLTIGDYNSVGNKSEYEIDGYLNDLVGIENDIINMVNLFGDDGFGYDIYPKYPKGMKVRTRWTEQQ